MHTSHRFNVASEAGAFFNRTCQTRLTVSPLHVCTGITVVQTPDDLPMYTELLDNSRARAACRGQAGRVGRPGLHVAQGPFQEPWITDEAFNGPWLFSFHWRS
jgi:hypothetical protein